MGTDKKQFKYQRFAERLIAKRAEGKAVDYCLANGKVWQFLTPEEKQEVTRRRSLNKAAQERKQLQQLIEADNLLFEMKCNGL